ncbi:MAG: GyrI-like domain-containing protein [Hyphomicrobiales bacterium]|nr:GyrI-like domain-containing protein [Hyphomicrobiales bacterium]
MPSKAVLLAVAAFFAALVAPPLPISWGDEAVPPSPPTQAQQPTAPSAPAPPAAASPQPAPGGQGGAPANPAPAAQAQPGAPSPSEGSKPQSAEGATGEIVDLPARPFAYVEGKADRDQIFNAILGSLGQVKREMDQAGVKASGRPLAVFVESDDSGFRYHAGFPLAPPPDGKMAPSGELKIGETPSAKAMRFEHVGAYADMDATYEAITAFLDEKGIDAQDTFIEEYANDVKDADDPTLEVNIYVLMK